MSEELSSTKSRVAAPPKDMQRRREMAESVARRYAGLNRSDPFAYARAHSRVMNGLFDDHDMASGNVGI